MKIVGLPPEPQTPWLQNNKSGVLPFTEQLKLLEVAYQASDNPDRLEILGPDKPRPSTQELVKKALEYYHSQTE
jgi:hypothetical protein